MSFDSVSEELKEPRLFVASLPFKATDNDLRTHFGQVGEVVYARVSMDRESGRSKGIGFVEMANLEQAQAAITQLHDGELMGRRLIVQAAKPRVPREGGFGGGDRGPRPPRREGGYGGGGGSRSGGGPGGDRGRRSSY
jgi:cold-inducible RNA-binding protein